MVVAPSAPLARLAGSGCSEAAVEGFELGEGVAGLHFELGGVGLLRSCGEMGEEREAARRPSSGASGFLLGEEVVEAVGRSVLEGHDLQRGQ